MVTVANGVVEAWSIYCGRRLRFAYQYLDDFAMSASYTMKNLYGNIEDSVSFGGAIRLARRRKNWTQEELAAKLSCTKTAVCKWEANKSIPPLSRFSALADTLGLTPGALFGLVERPTSQAIQEIKIDPLLVKAWQKLTPVQRTKLVQIAEILSR